MGHDGPPAGRGAPGRRTHGLDECVRGRTRRARRRSRARNAPKFDLRTALFKLCGVDLTAIDGIEVNTALKVLAEIGPDMSRFKSAKPFCSWLGLCPGTQVSGGQRLSGKTPLCAHRAARALKLAGGVGLQRRGRLDAGRANLEADLVREPSSKQQVLASADPIGGTPLEFVHAVHVLPPARPTLGMKDLLPHPLDGRLDPPPADKVILSHRPSLSSERRLRAGRPDRPGGHWQNAGPRTHSADLPAAWIARHLLSHQPPRHPRAERARLQPAAQPRGRLAAGLHRLQSIAGLGSALCQVEGRPDAQLGAESSASHAPPVAAKEPEPHRL